MWQCDLTFELCWLMAVDCVGRHARSWSYIQVTTCNHQNDGKTNNLGWMLYAVYAVCGVCLTWCMLNSVYAVLGVCCMRCMLYAVYAVRGVCCTWCMRCSVYAVLGECSTRYTLYSVYALLTVNSWWWHRKIGRNDLTLGPGMMVEWWTRRWEMRDQDENEMEDTRGYQISVVRRSWLGWIHFISV
jgi:hypothetical protein